jgi:putative SOS response-associated peptidase YedK
MCGRTSLFSPQPAIERRFEATVEGTYEPRYNIAPGDELVVVHDATPGTLTTDSWGYVPEWAAEFDGGPRPINARAETLAEQDLFAPAVKSRRALVIADGFYEWAGDRGGKQPYRIALGDQEPFAMAGVWSRWEGSGTSRSTVAIVTTDANDVLEPIHDRMPVVLDHDGERTWLESDSVDAALEVLRPYSGADMAATPVSTAVNDPANDSPRVTEPVGGDSGQTDLGRFGEGG